MIECSWDSRSAATVFSADSLHVVVGGWGAPVQVAPYGSVGVQIGENGYRIVELAGVTCNLRFTNPDARRFDQELATRRNGIKYAGDLATYPPVPLERVTTLQSLPGYAILEVVGIVTELGAASGLTAGMKGNEALDQAMDALRRTATQQRANAIVGLTGTTFGARGGVTSAFGGDAVGVLLMGTAVVVEPLDEPPNTPPASPVGADS